MTFLIEKNQNKTYFIENYVKFTKKKYKKNTQ